MAFSVIEASKKLGVSEITVRRLIKKKSIPHRRIGDRYLFTESDIENYLESVKIPAVSRQREAVNV